MKALRTQLRRCLVAVLPLLCSLGAGAAATPNKAHAPSKAAVQPHSTPAARPDKSQDQASKTARRDARAGSASRTRTSAAKRPPVARSAGKAPAVQAAGAKHRSASHAAAKAKGTDRNPSAGKAAGTAKAPAQARLDFSGRKRVGQASYYARRFAGRKMADGNPMRLNHHNAASKTLPLGTIAKVTNLKTGKSAVVKIQDRGPYAKGRIVDLSPATARAVGITTKEGVAPVEVTPIEVPMPDGSVKPGEAAHDPMARTQLARARQED